MTHPLVHGEWREKLPPICPNCGYNLTGLTRSRCPECGQPFFWSDIREHARDAYHSLRQIEDANDLCDLGIHLGAAAAIIVLFFWSIEWADGVGRVVGVFLAIATLGCGLQVTRVRGIPEWAREFLPAPPNYIKGAAVAMLGLADIAIAVFLP